MEDRVKGLETEIQKYELKVSNIIVSNAETFNYASEMVLNFSNLKKKINEYWIEPIKKANEAHKALTTKRNEMLRPIEANEKIIRARISSYLTEQKRKRDEEQRKIDEKRMRQEATEKRKLEERAMRAEASGKIEKAESLREQKEDVYIPPAIVVSEVNKTTRTDTGVVSAKADIEVAITDVKALLRAIVEGKAPVSIVDISKPKLKKFIKDMGIKNIPGCEIREVVDASFRCKV